MGDEMNRFSSEIALRFLQEIAGATPLPKQLKFAIFEEAAHFTRYFNRCDVSRLTLKTLRVRLEGLGLEKYLEEHRVIYGCLIVEVVRQMGLTAHFEKSVEDFERDYGHLNFSGDPLKLRRCCTLTRVVFHVIDPNDHKDLVRKVVGKVCKIPSSIGTKPLKRTGTLKVFPLQEFANLENKWRFQPVLHRVSAAQSGGIIQVPPAVQTQAVGNVHVDTSEGEKGVDPLLPYMVPFESTETAGAIDALSPPPVHTSACADVELHRVLPAPCLAAVVMDCACDCPEDETLVDEGLSIFDSEGVDLWWEDSLAPFAERPLDSPNCEVSPSAKRLCR